MLPDVGSGRRRVSLELAVRRRVHAVYQDPVGVLGEQGVPVAPPDHLDDVPAGTAEQGFQLLHDFAVAAYRAVETLQIAVHDEDQIIEFLPGRDAEGTD